MRQLITINKSMDYKQMNNNDLHKQFAKSNENPYEGSYRPMNNKDQPPQNNNGWYTHQQQYNMSDDVPPPSHNNNPFEVDQSSSKQQEIIFKEQPIDTLAHLSNGLEGSARKNFIKKVYSVLGLQLLFTIGICFLSYYSQGFLEFQINNYWLMYVSIALLLVTEIVIFCFPVGRQHPYNIILLSIFTIAEAYLVSFICSVFAKTEGAAVVVMAACMTLFIVACLTLYAIFTPRDFTTMWGIIIAILAPMIMLGIFAWIAWTPFLTTLYCSLGVILFGIYLVIDTQLIIGGRKLQLSLDDYVVGALLLYIDIIQIFLYLLMILGGGRN